MPDTPVSTPPDPPLLATVPPSEAIRQRLADLASERSQLRQLLRLAVRHERVKATREGGPSDED